MGADTYLVCVKCKKAINVGQYVGLGAPVNEKDENNEFWVEHNEFKLNWESLFVSTLPGMIVEASKFVFHHEDHEIFAASDAADLPWETEFGTIEKGWDIIEPPDCE